MAISLSVTVSIGLEMKGMLIEWFSETLVESSTWLGSTSVHPGRRIRSRNVTATSESLNFALNPFSDTYSQVLPVGFAVAWLLSLLYMAANRYPPGRRFNDRKRTCLYVTLLKIFANSPIPIGIAICQNIYNQNIETLLHSSLEPSKGSRSRSNRACQDRVGPRQHACTG